MKKSWLWNIRNYIGIASVEQLFRLAADRDKYKNLTADLQDCSGTRKRSDTLMQIGMFTIRLVVQLFIILPTTLTVYGDQQKKCRLH